MTATRLTGVVLAGGASTRMGRDKATLAVGGQRLVDRAIATLEPICVRVVVAAGSRRLTNVDVEQIDDGEGEGPLAGIVAGLRAAQTPLAAVIAVDMPAASPALLRMLAHRWRGEPAVVPRSPRGMEPLHAVYATDAEPAFSGELAARQYAVREAVVRLGAAIIPAGEDVYGDFARNLNAPADLPGGLNVRG